jgi:hypothetical protein
MKTDEMLKEIENKLDELNGCEEDEGLSTSDLEGMLRMMGRIVLASAMKSGITPKDLAIATNSDDLDKFIKEFAIEGSRAMLDKKTKLEKKKLDDLLEKLKSDKK